MASIFLMVSVLWNIFSLSVYGLDMCPEKLQAVLVLKIIPFIKQFEDTTKSAGGEIKIAVYGTNEIIQHFEAAATKMPFKVLTGSISNIETDLAGVKANIIYIPSGTPSTILEKISKQAKNLKILTVTGDPDAALNSNISLSFYILNESPKILINMKSAKEEGMVFSSKILGLADLRNVD